MASHNLRANCVSASQLFKSMKTLLFIVVVVLHFSSRHNMHSLLPIHCTPKSYHPQCKCFVREEAVVIKCNGFQWISDDFYCICLVQPISFLSILYAHCKGLILLQWPHMLMAVAEVFQDKLLYSPAVH